MIGVSLAVNAPALDFPLRSILDFIESCGNENAADAVHGETDEEDR
jgi:hypothetical protein